MITTIDPIIDAKTIRELIAAIDAKFGLNIPTDAPGAPMLLDWLDLKITVTQGDGNPVLYCAQATTPSPEFGLGINIQGTAVAKLLQGQVVIVMNKCTNS